VPRDRQASFDPQSIARYQRRFRLLQRKGDPLFRIA
jgi:transposase-like protein